MPSLLKFFLTFSHHIFLCSQSSSHTIPTVQFTSLVSSQPGNHLLQEALPGPSRTLWIRHLLLECQQRPGSLPPQACFCP